MKTLVLAPFSDAGLARLQRCSAVTYESWLDTGLLWDPQELGTRLREQAYDALVVEADFVFEELFEAAIGLRIVGVCRNALNHVDLHAATARSIPIVHAAGRNTTAVAEMTVGLMFTLGRHICAASSMVHAAKWNDPAGGYREFRGREIAGSTVGIIGLGQIGRAVARNVKVLGATVLAYDPFVPETHVRAVGARPATLEELASRSDFVTVHVSDSAGTHRLVDETFLSRMKRSAYLVNTAAGGAVDTAALIGALHDGRIAGAALDVFDGQPLPVSSPLLTVRNLVLTPHIAGATAETVERHSRIICSEFERFVAGEPLHYVVNPEYEANRAG